MRTACWSLTACIPYPWCMTRFRVYIQRVVNEAVNFQFPVIFCTFLWHLVLVICSSTTHLCSSLPHSSFPLSFFFSSFFLPPVYNWILFSGCCKCLCLLCLCLAPHFLSLLHRHPLLLSFPSPSPSFCCSVQPLLLFSRFLFFPQTVSFQQNLPLPFSSF